MGCEKDGPTDQKRLGQSSMMLEEIAIKPAIRRERQGREESSVSYAQFRIGRSHGSLGGGNVGPALQQQRGHADGNRGRRGQDRPRGQ